LIDCIGCIANDPVIACELVSHDSICGHHLGMDFSRPS
jgi:hypothetical protein